MDTVHMTDLIASLGNDVANKAPPRQQRDRRLVGRASTVVRERELKEVVKESSRIFRQWLKDVPAK